MSKIGPAPRLKGEDFQVFAQSHTGFMSTFYIVEHVATPTDCSRITDLDVMMVDGQAYLFASTHYDGTLTNWAISQSGLTLVGTTA
jgi:hypothetical protein